MKSNIAIKGCDVVKAQRKGGVKKILATFSYDVMLFYWVEKPSIAMANALFGCRLQGMATLWAKVLEWATCETVRC